MSETVPITLPSSVPFPVTISSILCSSGDSIRKRQTIFKYKYWDYQDDPNSKDDPPPKIRVERIGAYESPVEGEVLGIKTHENAEINHSGIVLCSIREPCAHAVQYGGLCALCGKAVEDEKDYTGFNYEDRATISMSHDNTGLKISYEEAAKIEQNSTTRLTQQRKLILVVDLDQTVIHATVDPTVGEWQSDPSNPNYRAVKDVQSFCLEEEPITPPNWSGPKLSPTKCWYYVKLRPGLEEFLREMAEIYEMHIYTMATRNYALAIAKIIDPEGEYFGDRILSRDESGSLTHKNLKRLFPVDQSMVAIIDDRGDVWQWEDNLIKVVPYDFFVGIGDINSSFLPKKNTQITGPSKKRKSIAKLEAMEEDLEHEFAESDNGDAPDSESDVSDTGDSKEDKENIDHSHSAVDRLVEIGGGEDNKNLLIEQSRSRTLSLEQQQHDRPLAKLQHDLEKINHDHETKSDSEHSSNENDDAANDEEEDNLLYDDDNELESLKVALSNIHNEYYKILDSKNPERPDLTYVIPNLKSKCLEGVVILFSGIIPLGINPDSADIVIWCKQFGVKVVNEVYPEVTHVVCRDPNSTNFKGGLTFKVKAAKKLIPNIKIVTPDWLFVCLSSWKQVDEADYSIDEGSQNWYVDERDLDKYQKALQEQKQQQHETIIARPRFDSIASMEDYDLDEANEEVDDFLAGLSDDDEEENEDHENSDDEDDEAVPAAHDSFIREAYLSTSKKRSRDDEADDSDQGPNEVPHAKKNKIVGKGEVAPEQENEEAELYELEQELLDGFDDLDE
ncbi:CTD phosphatase Fcp1 [Yamadazyma tenuis]|uniref:RNA polymerase II subunit A C-terminal domain phosphatase n=1 Tax=Candida tenuis (strain ATCC 10573 / BCRC 21748 / CBS 615 / JCM 9827 / NBRC 10315 / NRRL Y-1498 / VKM Y-70) TaxID=590646 RepID=G3B0X3_CANTC|nr:uncharacterized protein CANTEDRAFT_104476 [Yamadazyma tenuis ATCC 10573]XP_006686016.1 uncharacterized protein CANTEDRAFT_104476 [Yamadazyma tenuis ATCC 10573]EGV65209.1 hypothetical protein CANTEDRAFT_104476 [Yamadazyma tenuis ATCC 10573]EGV65210.1 hypothetical protein CANTEDRAFT_104476 [Yamadazyma tenuis ATCC 10573]WEJ97621.1 CTD phosphatase Fcp1 [Yamadazyma tenuis]